MMHEIAKKSKDIFINTEKSEETATMISDIISKYYEKDIYQSTQKYLRHQSKLYPTVCDNKTLDWLFVLNALNFSLWCPESSKQWTVNGHKGFTALGYAINRAINEGKPMWCPTYYSIITSRELKIIFRSDDKKTIIPLIDERVSVLREIGTILLDKFQGTFKNCIEVCKGEGDKLLYLLFEEFQSFRDRAYYEEEEVYIGSKAIILLSDLLYFRQISLDKDFVFPIFHHYRMPQVFYRLGILRYSDRLVTRFTKDIEPVKPGSKEEVEIRCITIVACCLLLRNVISKCALHNKEVSTLHTLDFFIYFDNFLCSLLYMWDNQLHSIPHHNTKSIYY